MLLATGWLALFGYSLHAGMPFNPVRLPFEDRFRASLLMPEGWKFFTRDAREERVFLYVKSDGRWHAAMKTPHASATNAFGPRAVHVPSRKRTP